MTNKVTSIPSFSFDEGSLSEIEWELNLMNPRKATWSNNILLKLLEAPKGICSETLKTIFNNCLIKTNFPN